MHWDSYPGVDGPRAEDVRPAPTQPAVVHLPLNYPLIEAAPPTSGFKPRRPASLAQEVCAPMPRHNYSLFSLYFF